MFWTLVTAIFAGFAGAGVGFALRHLSGRRLPKGIVPIAAGIMPAATAAAEPDEEPPGVWRGSWGLRVFPGWK